MPDHLKGLASQPGRVRCLRCLKKFRSPDHVRIRICPKCKTLPDQGIQEIPANPIYYGGYPIDDV